MSQILLAPTMKYPIKFLVMYPIRSRLTICTCLFLYMPLQSLVIPLKNTISEAKLITQYSVTN